MNWLNNLETKNITNGGRIGGLLGMLGCYTMILGGMFNMDDITKVIGWFLLSSAIGALLGALIALMIEITKNRTE